jgi:CBS domain containing-hemolysin-like protein
MPHEDPSQIFDLIGILGVLLLVAANGYFVAAEFSLVAVRRSRVTELVAAGRTNASALKRAVDNLDAYLAATQLGITISSLALGWIGEPAIAHLIEPPIAFIAGDLAAVSSHVIAVAIAFVLITVLHIVLGELAPKSLALQRSEGTALWVVRPLEVLLFVLRPAIFILNGLGNLVLRAFGLRPGGGEEALHSPQELKLLIAASQEGGLLQEAQEEVVGRVLDIGDRNVGDIMTPRLQLDWIDLDDTADEIRRTILDSRHEQLLVGRGNIEQPIGMVVKKDMLDQMLRGEPLDPTPLIREPLVIHDTTKVFRMLEQFKKAPVRLAMVLDEYGSLEGIVTQTDLLEAIAGDLPDDEGDLQVVRRSDGSLLIDGMMSARDAFDLLELGSPGGDFHTVAGFAISQFRHLPRVGESFVYRGWRFEIMDIDGRRIDKLLASREG